MGKRHYRDIEIRGVVYPTVQDAARALGVQDQTVLKAIQTGKLDGVGLRQSHPAPTPVRVRGKFYPSASAAAKALGLTTSAIYNAINEGREDSVGLPQVRKGLPKPVQIGPLHFPSMLEASRALGFRGNYVSHARRKGRASSLQRILGAAMKLEQQVLRERVKAEQLEWGVVA